MHMCNYCHTPFSPRPQVKNPKACPKGDCQKARQRGNEKHWRERNKVHYPKDYYELQRCKRAQAISEWYALDLTCKTA